MSAIATSAILGTAAINGTSGVVGAIGNYHANKALQENAQAFSAEEALKQRNWEEYMSSSSYQRQVADMQAAGLNVGAIGAQANGASTPNGATAQGVAAHTSAGLNFDNLFTTACNLAMAKDKNLESEVITQMKAVAGMEVQKTINHSREYVAAQRRLSQESIARRYKNYRY